MSFLAHRSSDKTLDGLRFLPPRPLSECTSLKVGGTPVCFAEVFHEDGLEGLCSLGWPLRVLGRGSNLIVDDGELPFGVVRFQGALTKTLPILGVEGDKVFLEAFSGVALRAMAKKALEMGGGGLEFGITIPGSLGGALRMNAGAHGQEIGPLVESLTVFDPKRGELRKLKKEEFSFGYRSFEVRGASDDSLFLVNALLLLTKRDPKDISATMDAFLSKRKATQPSGVSSCGCVFKNPPLPMPSAGRLLDLSGLKGACIGGAMVSQAHANFFVNTGNAKASDFFRLIDLARNRVLKDHGISLSLEVEIWRG